nr:helix-turn-helix transcriptional regulator [uncultured Cellulosilyticum sp.]
MKFNIKLKQFRDNLGLTQEQFAKKVGFSRTTISELENGSRKATLKTIEKIANNTNTSVSDWLDEDDNISVKQFEGLTMVIDTLLDVGQIDSDGTMTNEARSLLMKMLESEVKLYINNKKN